ncbi:MAG: TlpA family protein disulfide reductase [Acidimicrobiia bacterium]|nr:TlpA family protein disulfide reductase [Acidimicrobiia bacterium]
MPLGFILGGVFTVLLIVTVFLTMGDDGEASDAGLPDEYGSPTVEGSLPLLADALADPAIGTAAPEVFGADFNGTPVSIADDGRAKIILIVAHWCQFCQAEVPWVSEWLNTNEMPAGVDFYGVATSIDRTLGNWPPSDWLEREGFSAPVLVDDRINSVANSFGLPAYPFWVFVNADGTVAARISGGISAADLDRIVASLAQA